MPAKAQVLNRTQFNYDQCMNQVGSGASNKFSSYQNLVNYCKCTAYVMNETMTTEQQQNSGVMVMLTGVKNPELLRAEFEIRARCNQYMG